MGKAHRVLVTGASGFIAKHVVSQLLQSGATVIATVRNSKRADELHAAVLPTVKAADAAGRLICVKLDLEADEGWADAMRMADVVMHTASPFPLSQPSKRLALVGPAVDGTQRVLQYAQAAGIRRVVLTSSVVAVAYPSELPVDRPIDERDWSDPDSPRMSPYAVSKTLAEQAAWSFVHEQAPEIALTTLLPGLVLGAPLDERFGTSLAVVQRLLRGRDPMLPNFGLPAVDVRDVAAAHVRCIDTRATFGKRLILGDEFLWYPDMACTLASWYPRRWIPSFKAPNTVIQMLAMFDPSARAIASQLDYEINVTCDAARKALKLPAIPAEQALRDSAEFLLGHGLV